MSEVPLYVIFNVRSLPVHVVLKAISDLSRSFFDCLTVSLLSLLITLKPRVECIVTRDAPFHVYALPPLKHSARYHVPKTGAQPSLI